jgi:hypothetical protein
MNNIEMVLQVFIDEVNDENYAEYSVQGDQEVYPLADADLVELPFTPRELEQNRIMVWAA